MAKKRKSRTQQPEPVPMEEEEQQQTTTQPPQEEEPGPTVNDVVPSDPQPQQDEKILEEDIEEEEEDPQEIEDVEEEIEEEEEESEHDEDENKETTENDVVPTTESNGVKQEGEKEEEEDMELEDEPVEKLLEPFSKEQLISLLKEAVSKHPDLIENVSKIADIDPAHRKIFVHGLGWDTNSDVLISEFGKYGEIEDCKAVVDKVSGKSKGYAFILFKHRAGAQKALKEPQKKIGNRMTSCQLASAGPVPAPPPVVQTVSEYTQRKIFVSNVAADIDPGKLTEFFAKFGEIDDGPLGLDKQTGKPKGFALYVYKTVEGAKKALEEPHKVFEGHTLHCQKAVDGPKPNKPFFQQGGSGGHGNQHYGGGHGGHGHHVSKKGKFSGGGGGSGGHGHLMAPSYNTPVPPALTPALGQALTALLATQGGGLGNLLGLGGPPQGMPPGGGYGNQGGGGYGAPQGMQGAYPPQGGNRPPYGR
uniref:UBP1-associated protein 2B-like n=1 Tax=Erigeron canadensis TaxID=72917 RepID=UPI001CB99942|nr:UBP1-associated protein 2B-like [Erigeron canadensis]XP_043627110.1 UBP1-associated protein 2B-like [Erigeron canadensis]